MRRSLVTLNAWLSRELDAIGRGVPRRSRAAGHGVLTPAGRGRQESVEDGGDADARPKRMTSRLATVVTRARWKAAACRLSLDKRAHGQEDAPESEGEAIAQREVSLRARLAALPDTGTWMLDLPFGRRLNEPDSLLVDEDQAKRLAQVADCYDALATGAEIAVQLDEAGAFKRSPPPMFLYLLAEAQSALLQSLADAPTRSDSDQRDVFLWLKEQTTRYRIYVDRYMRLDDPADPKTSADLVDRMRRAAREITEKAKQRRERAQLLSKVRYHVGKLEHQLLATEVDSLRQGLEEWQGKGLQRSDRSLLETLQPMRELIADGGEPSDLLSQLQELLEPYEAESASGSGSGDAPQQASRTEGAKPASPAADSPKAQQTLEEIRVLLAELKVALLVDHGTEFDADALIPELGARELSVVTIDIEGDAQTRRDQLSTLLDDGSDLYLLGVRFAPDEYQGFKDQCLEHGRQFVRLPGALDGKAIAHQISRQVGWRLRERGDAPRPS